MGNDSERLCGLRPVLSTARVAELLDCSAEHVCALLRRGVLRGFKLPNPRAKELRPGAAARWRVYAESVAELTGQKLDARSRHSRGDKPEEISDAESYALTMKARASLGYLNRRSRLGPPLREGDL